MVKYCQSCRSAVATRTKKDTLGRIKHVCDGCFTRTSGFSLTSKKNKK